MDGACFCQLSRNLQQIDRGFKRITISVDTVIGGISPMTMRFPSLLRPSRIGWCVILGAILMGVAANYVLSPHLLPGIMGDGPSLPSMPMQILGSILVLPGYVIFFHVVAPIGALWDEIWVVVLHPTELITVSNGIGYGLMAYLCVGVWNYRILRRQKTRSMAKAL